MAKDMRMDLHLLNVQNPDNYMLASTYSTAGTDVIQMQYAASDNAMKILAQEITGMNTGDVKIDYSSDIGITRFLIEQYVTEGKADMVALEEKHEKDFWSPNSTNLEIIRQLDCPVWIIPHGSIYMPFNTIVYATDYKEQDQPTMNSLIRLMSQFSPDITALHITDSYDFDELTKKTGFNELIRQTTGYEKIRVKSVLNITDDNVAEIIIDYALDITADLIVLLKKNRTFFEKIFTVSATKKIVKASPLPLLIYQERT